MPIASIKDVEVGSIVTFRSKNANDTVVWKGTLEAIGNIRMARAYRDPRAYNEAVRQSDSGVPSDITLLTYFLITVDNDATVPTAQIFADEWITSGSLAVVTAGNKVTIEVSDPLNSPNQILSLLASAGYAAKLVS